LVDSLTRSSGLSFWWSSGLASRLHAGVALNLVGGVFNQGSTFLVNIVVANLLGRETFGEFTMVLATVATLATIGQLSMGYTATKHVAEFRSVDAAKASRILGLCGVVSGGAALVVALGLALPADWLASTVLKAPHLGWELRIAAVAVFFSIVNGFLAGSLAGLESYPAVAKAGVASGTLYAIVCMSFTALYGLGGAVTGVAVSALMQSLILGTLLGREAARQGIIIDGRGLLHERSVISKFAVPASLTGFVSLPAVWIAAAFLARLPNGYHELALFGAANSFRTMVLFLPQTINNVGMSVLNNQRRTSEQGFRRVFWINAILTAVTAVTGACVILIASMPLLRMFGSSFIDGRKVLMILMIPAVLEASGLALYQIIVSRGRMWASFLLVSLPRDSTLVFAAATLSPVFGAAGLAAAYGISWVVGLVGITVIVSRLGIGVHETTPALTR
jgi:O-antigen/teichoic acid export membrane protein